MLVASSLGGLIMDDLIRLKFSHLHFLSLYTGAYIICRAYIICLNEQGTQLILLTFPKRMLFVLYLHMNVYFTYYMKFHIK